MNLQCKNILDRWHEKEEIKEGSKEMKKYEKGKNNKKKQKERKGGFSKETLIEVTSFFKKPFLLHHYLVE